jgi:hydroxypyruvate reductase
VQPNDIVLCLLSGGASALWTDLPDGISLNELQNLFQLLLNCGANIDEMNCVRKHLSCIKEDNCCVMHQKQNGLVLLFLMFL